MTWFSEHYCTGAFSRQLPQRALQARVVHRLSWLGGRTNGLVRSDTADRQQLHRTVLARRPHGVVGRQPLFCHADRLSYSVLLRECRR
jgi:hypothetical protein